MACKRPIFMLIDGVSRKLVEDAKCGVYVEPENPEEFARQIEIFLKTEKEALVQQGESGYQFAKNHFDRNILAESYLQKIAKNANK